MSRPSWIQQSGLRNVKLGAVVDGVKIGEENRATVYEYRRKGIEELLGYMTSQYLNKGVKAVLVGVDSGCSDIRNKFQYAVFVQEGFITNLTTEDA